MPSRQLKQEMWRELDLSTREGKAKLDALFQQRVKVHFVEYPDKKGVYGLAGARTGQLFYQAGIGGSYTNVIAGSWHYYLHHVMQAIFESVESDIRFNITCVVEANGTIRWITDIAGVSESGPTPAISAMCVWLAVTDP